MLIEDLDRRGIDTAPLLADVGVSRRQLQGAHARLPIVQIVGIFEAAAEATGDQSLGFRFAQTREPQDAGLLGYVGMSSPTLGDALMNLAHYSRINSDASVVDVSRLRKEGRIRFDAVIPPGVHARQHNEWGLTILVQAFRKITGRALRPREISFRLPRNSNISEFQRFFGCEMRFGTGMNEVVWRIEDLETPLLTADSRLHKILREHCELVLAERKQASLSLVNKVERLIADRLSKTESSIDEIAAALGMSARTLSRRLADHGTSFKQVIDGYRKALALEFLRNSDLNLLQIAFLLGYNEVSSLHHACKRWTGRTPNALRAEAKGGAGAVARPS